MSEEWRPVVGWEGIYAVSDQGRVRRELQSPGARAGVILKGQPNSGGYQQVTLWRSGKSKMAFRHHLVLDAFVRPRRAGEECNHGDGDTTNNRLDNLEWATKSENIRHSYRHLVRKPSILTGQRGVAHHAAKLDEGAVREIRRLRATGVTLRMLATRFGVSSPTIVAVVLRRTWTHVV